MILRASRVIMLLGGTDPGMNEKPERGRTPADEPDDLPNSPTATRGPDELSALPKTSYFAVFKRVLKEFGEDNITVWAAALTYYGVLSIFPGLLLLVTVLKLFGSDTVQKVVDNVKSLSPGSVANLVGGAATILQHSPPCSPGILQ